jgi:hypothetical protein
MFVRLMRLEVENLGIKYFSRQPSPNLSKKNPTLTSMENISNRTSHELYHGRVNSILKMGPCAYGPIKAIDSLPKGLDVHTNGSNFDCVVGTTSISLLFLHPRCDSSLWCLSPKWKCHKLQRNFVFCQIQYLCMWITLI